MQIKRRNIKHILFSWVLILTLINVYIIKDIHLSSHCDLSDNRCEASADSDNSKHDCPICHFYFDPFVKSDSLTIDPSVAILALEQSFFIDNITVDKYFSCYLRAPPVFI